MCSEKLNSWCGYWAEVPYTAEKYIFIPKAGGGCYTIMYLSSCCIGKEVWYITFDNCLRKINIETGVNKLVYEFNETEKWSYWQPVCASDWLVALPLWSSSIAAYNIRDGRVNICSAIGLECAVRIGYYDGKIFYWSHAKQKMICYTIETNMVNEVDMMQSFEERIIPYGMTSIEMVGTKGYFAAFGTNILYEFDILTQEMKLHVIDCAGITFSSVTVYKDGFFLFGMQADKAVFWQPNARDALVWSYDLEKDRWDSQMVKLSDERKTHVLTSKEIASNTHHFCELVPKIWNNRIVIMNSKNDSYLFCVENGDVEKINMFSNVPQYELCRFSEIIDNEICLLPIYDDCKMYFSDGRILKMDEGLEYKALCVDSDNLLLQESQLWTLGKYISAVKGQV